ncbi:MAG: polyphosphate kinase 1, partial [Candidatus Aegiribacteria sp.]|nr:polyphosphate kinase 1 [Candidatus Aegiribacteria sp.]MBD3295433.1 polyphosphate kinase 1 [Candidatus Fermentibacteria bacterium]
RLEMVVSPLSLSGPGSPPLLPGLELICLFLLQTEVKGKLVALPVPTSHGRFLRLPGEEERLVAMEEVVADNAASFFKGCTVQASTVIRITRNAEMELHEEDVSDFMMEMERMVRHRRRRAPVRLEVSQDTSEELLEMLKKVLDLSHAHIYRCDGPVGLSSLMELVSLDGFEEQRDPEWPAARCALLPPECDPWQVISGRDVMLMHPYESFQHVVDLVQRAADDPEVLAIRQTLYRTSSDSPIVRALERAALSGKQVTVLVELKARFDEARNMDWARKLEDAGCHVVYGVAGLKTHAKAMLIVRRESGRITRFAHLSTGNYNDKTAGLYSDVGILTSNERICSDLSALFNMLTGLSEAVSWSALTIAPIHLRRRMEELIEREKQLSSRENPGLIMAKMNSLEDPGMITALCDAGQSGVEVRLNVRGICCLRPGVKDKSENIRVVSILDRFLEHARIYYFHNAGSPELFIASADLMNRNLDKRIELMIPVLQNDIRDRIVDALHTYMSDNVRGRELKSDGTWKEPKVKKKKKMIRAQKVLYKKAVRLNDTAENRFRPREGQD